MNKRTAPGVIADLASRIESMKQAGTPFQNEMNVGSGGKHSELLDPDGNRIELFEPSTAMSGLHPAIESRSQFLSEWLIPVLAGIVLVAFILGAAALVLRN